MVKRKGSVSKDAHFVSPLPIEECAQRLEFLHDETLQTEILRLSSDKVDFRLRLYEYGRLRAEGTGTLRRWEGTLTRVDCKVQVREGLVLWIALSLTALLLTVLVIPVLTLAIIGVGAGLWLVVGGFGVAAVAGLLLLAQRFSPMDDVPRNILAIIEATLH